ncbi:MAG: NADH-quinone oxidoreductase subunit J, partial [Pseudomonadota bacterium]
MFSGLFFYLFAAVLVLSGVMVIAARNTVHSVLFLILAFINASGLFLLLGAEFLALILVIVYVGAVAVLFLFVVMMLDVDFAKLREGFLQYLPVGGLVGLALLSELLLVVGSWTIKTDPAAPMPILPEPSNTAAIGQVLYTQYFHLFQLSGLVLLVAMIGAIVLTLHHRPNIRRQNIANQNARTPEDSVEVV